MAELVKTTIATTDISKTLVYTAASGTDYIVDNVPDDRTYIFARNTDPSHAATIVFAAGDGTQALLGPVTVTVAAGAAIVVPMSNLESARVKLLADAANSGANKGNIVVTESIASGGTLSLLLIAVVTEA